MITRKIDFEHYYDFLEKDPFNYGNTMEGKLSFHRDYRYGALQIHKVNNEKVKPYTILGTPKIRDPYDRDGNYQFPSATEILSFDKYDGTNIFMYKYYDAEGMPYITYKVRQYPFLRNIYLTMWKQMLKTYPNLPKLFLANKGLSGFSFELYGNLNPHLIHYKTPLDTILLFALDSYGNIVPNTKIDSLDIPKVEPNLEITRDYVWNFEQQRKETDKKLKLSEIINDRTDEPMYTGSEGHVWYLREKKEYRWQQYRCKASEIELIHKTPQNITKDVIKTTALNALEQYDYLTEDIVNNLLSEEFNMMQIENSFDRIRKTVDTVNKLAKLKKRARETMKKMRLSPTLETTDILRHINIEFEKTEMKQVYLVVKFLQKQYQVLGTF